MVGLDDSPLDAWGGTSIFYPLLLALFLPAILVTATRALGPGAATATAVIFTVQHVVILLALRAFGWRTPTFTPIPFLPALAIDLVVAAFPVPRYSALAPVLAGVALSLVLYTQEAAWMVWAVGRPWDLGRVAAAFPGVTLTAIGSAWVGWVLGALVASVAAGRAAGETFGSRPGARATVDAAPALV